MLNNVFTYSYNVEQMLRGRDINVVSNSNADRLLLVKKRRAHNALFTTLNLFTLEKNTPHKMNIYQFLSLFSECSQVTMAQDVVCTFPLKVIQKYLFRHKDVHSALNAKRQGAKYHLLMYADGFGILFFYSFKRMKIAKGYKRSAPVITLVPLTTVATNDLLKSLSESEYRPMIEPYLKT